MFLIGDFHTLDSFQERAFHAYVFVKVCQSLIVPEGQGVWYNRRYFNLCYLYANLYLNSWLYLLS